MEQVEFVRARLRVRALQWTHGVGHFIEDCIAACVDMSIDICHGALGTPIDAMEHWADG